MNLVYCSGITWILKVYFISWGWRESLDSPPKPARSVIWLRQCNRLRWMIDDVQYLTTGLSSACCRARSSVSLSLRALFVVAAISIFVLASSISLPSTQSLCSFASENCPKRPSLMTHLATARSPFPVDIRPVPAKVPSLTGS